MIALHSDDQCIQTSLAVCNKVHKAAVTQYTTGLHTILRLWHNQNPVIYWTLSLSFFELPLIWALCKHVWTYLYFNITKCNLKECILNIPRQHLKREKNTRIWSCYHNKFVSQPIWCLYVPPIWTLFVPMHFNLINVC